MQASVVVAHGLSSCGLWALELRLSSCGARALLLHGMRDLPGPGLEPVSPALAGGFLTTAPPGKTFCVAILRQNYFFFRKPHRLLLRLSTDQMRPTHFMEGNWLYSKSTNYTY